MVIFKGYIVLYLSKKGVSRETQYCGTLDNCIKQSPWDTVDR